MLDDIDAARDLAVFPCFVLPFFFLLLLMVLVLPSII